MSFIPINFLPMSEIDKHKKKQEKITVPTDRLNVVEKYKKKQEKMNAAPDPFNIEPHAEAEWKNHENEIIQTYLNTLRVLKATNEMLRSENKLLFQELNKYKKKVEDES
jgi:hypothetical protein